MISTTPGSTNGGPAVAIMSILARECHRSSRSSPDEEFYDRVTDPDDVESFTGSLGQAPTGLET